MAILDGNQVYSVDFGDESLEIYWTPDANEQAMTVCLFNDATGEEMHHDLPVSDMRDLLNSVTRALEAAGC